MCVVVLRDLQLGPTGPFNPTCVQVTLLCRSRLRACVCVRDVGGLVCLFLCRAPESRSPVC